MEPYLKPARTAGGTLVQFLWNLPQPRPPREIGGILVEPLWNPGGNLVKPYLKPPGPPYSPCKSDGTLVESYFSPCRWWNSSKTLVELLGNRSRDPGRTLVEPEEIGGTLVVPLWNLTSNHPRPPRSPCRTWWTVAPNHPAPHLG